jgi:hypothetical protein
MSGLGSALDSAIGAWNTALATTGMEFERVGTGGCTNGPAACVTVREQDHEKPGGGWLCGNTDWDVVGVDGVIPSGALLDIGSGWSAWDTASKVRTFLHELGHFLGSRNLPLPCQPNDAVMQDGFSCGATANPSTTITSQDSIPIVNSVYLGKSKKTCGF